MPRAVMLALAAIVVFGVVVAVLVALMPAPLHSTDYLIIGSVATLVALLVLFLVVISTTLKSSDVFFKRRKK